MSIALGRKIYTKLAWLNELPESEAYYVFNECSGSPAWAEAMAAARPFPMLEQLYSTAAAMWENHGNGAEFAEIGSRIDALLER
ncbi:MAG: hypothetical protein KF736_04235 [Acidobacteria bacterium]|nr:hypothetical protein [Acidobacteriota bacterium]MCW5948408.1 hypothetical protein [Pyrinomonadaceae bacterium]